MVHYKRFDALEARVLYVIDVPDTTIESAAISPSGWDGNEPLPAAQAIGDTWCDERRTPALLVPSAATPGELNLIINSRHPDWQWEWVTSGPATFAFDARLAGLIGRSRKQVLNS